MKMASLLALPLLTDLRSNSSIKILAEKSVLDPFLLRKIKAETTTVLFYIEIGPKILLEVVGDGESVKAAFEDLLACLRNAVFRVY